MSICICEAKTRAGVHRCRAYRIEPATGHMTCQRVAELVAIVRANIVDGSDCVDDLEVDTAGLIRALRAAGWRVTPPRRAPDTAQEASS